MSLDLSELRESVRERLTLAEVMGRDGVVLRRVGATRHSCLCPFHVEKSPSFVVGGKVPDRGHCFGCGWDGDIFSYWMAQRSVEFVPALIELADMCGALVPPALRDPNYKPSRPPERPARAGDRLVAGDLKDDSVMPSLPPLRRLRPEECELIARGRGLSVEAVKVCAWEYRRMAFSMWPLYETSRRGEGEGGGVWLPKSQGAWPSWVAIDHTRHVAEYRRLDGLRYARQDGGEIKSWSTAGKNWPLGAAQIGARPAVLLVEGGPDMIAAYHFLLRWRMLERVAVVCMLGASNSIRAEARALFKGKKVRIMQDADAPKDDDNVRKRKMPGAEASARWERELTEAGASVENFSVGPIYEPDDVAAWGRGEMGAEAIRVRVPGLTKPDGSLVKDVNDLALCPASVTDAPEIKDAFCAWAFE